MSSVSEIEFGAARLDDQQTIAELRAEIDRLRNRVADDAFARELRDAFTLATFTGAIASPFGNSRLLRMIVETASYFLSAQAASLFLIDEARQDLVVACALGPKAALVEQIRVPLGHGIAGLVAVSGQALAIADVVGDPRHAADVSRVLGHVPQSILCVPLLHNERVIGVLELLDKEHAPAAIQKHRPGRDALHPALDPRRWASGVCAKDAAASGASGRRYRDPPAVTAGDLVGHAVDASHLSWPRQIPGQGHGVAGPATGP